MQWNVHVQREVTLSQEAQSRRARCWQPNNGQSRFWKADYSSAHQETPRVLYIPKIHYRVHISSFLIQTLYTFQFIVLGSISLTNHAANAASCALPLNLQHLQPIPLNLQRLIINILSLFLLTSNVSSSTSSAYSFPLLCKPENAKGYKCLNACEEKFDLHWKQKKGNFV
jgi:hypothetical protein